MAHYRSNATKQSRPAARCRGPGSPRRPSGRLAMTILAICVGYSGIPSPRSDRSRASPSCSSCRRPRAARRPPPPPAPTARPAARDTAPSIRTASSARPAPTPRPAGREAGAGAAGGLPRPLGAAERAHLDAPAAAFRGRPARQRQHQRRRLGLRRHQRGRPDRLHRRRPARPLRIIGRVGVADRQRPGGF